MRKHIAPILAALVAGIAQDVQLHIEQFFELQANTGTLHLVGCLRIVYPAQGLIARTEMQTAGDEGRQRLRDDSFHHIATRGEADALQQRLDDLLHTSTLQPAALHLLGSHVVGLHTHLRQHELIGRVDVGMRELESPVIDARLAEHHILYTHLVLLVDILRAVEPHEVDDAETIGEVCYDALLARSLTELLERQYLAFQLHKRHIGLQLITSIDAAAVDIFVRIVLQQLAPRINAELLLQNLGAPRTHTGQVLDVLVEDVHSIASATFKSKGVVILIFSRLPSTRETCRP